MFVFFVVDYDLLREKTDVSKTKNRYEKYYFFIILLNKWQKFDEAGRVTC